MLTAFAAEGFVQLGQRMAAKERDATDGPSALAAAGVAYVMFAVDEPLRFQVMFRTDRLLPHDPEYLTACRDSFIPLQRAIDRGVAEGLIGDGETDDVMLAAWSLVHGLANLWFSKHLSGRVQPDPEVLGRRITRLFANAILSPDRVPLAPEPPRPETSPQVAPSVPPHAAPEPSTVHAPPAMVITSPAMVMAPPEASPRPESVHSNTSAHPPTTVRPIETVTLREPVARPAPAPRTELRPHYPPTARVESDESR